MCLPPEICLYRPFLLSWIPPNPRHPICPTSPDFMPVRTAYNIHVQPLIRICLPALQPTQQLSRNPDVVKQHHITLSLGDIQIPCARAPENLRYTTTANLLHPLCIAVFVMRDREHSNGSALAFVGI